MSFLSDFLIHNIFNLPLLYVFYYYHTNVISKIREQYNQNFTILVEQISEIDKTISKINYEINENNKNIKKLFLNNEEDRDHITAIIGIIEKNKLEDEYVHS
jgi:hypothetical protein